jgi:hypothetical protein
MLTFAYFMVPGLAPLALQLSDAAPIPVAPPPARSASLERAALAPGHAVPFARTAHAWLLRAEVGN